MYNSHVTTKQTWRFTYVVKLTYCVEQTWRLAHVWPAQDMKIAWPHNKHYVERLVINQQEPRLGSTPSGGVHPYCTRRTISYVAEDADAGKCICRREASFGLSHHMHKTWLPVGNAPDTASPGSAKIARAGGGDGEVGGTRLLRRTLPGLVRAPTSHTGVRAPATACASCIGCTCQTWRVGRLDRRS